MKSVFSDMIRRRNLRDTDVLLASFPKSGNTWIRFVWANMVSLMDLDGRPVDYQLLNGDLIAEYDTNTYGSIEFDSLPRLVKTHRPYSAWGFGRRRSIYLVRHPGDTMVSYYEYRRHLKDPQKRPTSFKALIRSREWGLPAWCKHVASWTSVATRVITYEMLWQDAFHTMSKLLDDLGIRNVSDDVLRTAVDRSDFRRVRSMEEAEGLDEAAQQRHIQGFRFARRGEPGQWHEYFDDDDVQYLHDLVTEYGIAASRIDDSTGSSPVALWNENRS